MAKSLHTFGLRGARVHFLMVVEYCERNFHDRLGERFCIIQISTSQFWLTSSFQKIVAFENAFERLLNIVSVEGNSDGGIIVEDCLSLLLNLLRNNLSNQNFFRETR